MKRRSKQYMRAQRVREGESRVEMQTAKWTAEGAVKGIMLSILRRRAYVSCRKYAGISQVHGSYRESRWHHGWIFIRSSLADSKSRLRAGVFFFAQKTFHFLNERKKIFMDRQKHFLQSDDINRRFVCYVSNTRQNERNCINGKVSTDSSLQGIVCRSLYVGRGNENS